ncbi:MAG: hypothetical protein ACI4CZ_04020 [Hominisplanchenecus sp.]
MKKSKVLSVILTLLFVFGINFCVASAAGSGEIYLNAKKARTGIVTVSCEVQGIEGLTNGKIRIRYAAEKLKLERSELGSAIAGFMTQINDPIQGTKPEGEIVFVFASSDAKKAEGSVLNLTFSMKDDVALSGEDFSVSVEELSNGTEKLPVQVTSTRYEQEKEIQKTNITDVTIAPIPDQTYTGKKIRPALTVTCNNAVLQAGKDYTVSYSYNKKIGRASVNVTGIGEYVGSRTVSFYIAPKAPSVKKISSPSKKKISLSWTKIKVADGYQIQVATNKSFTKNVKTFKIKKKSITKTILKVKGKRKYYVRIRSYKKIDGGYRYGAYSPSKKVRVK